MEGYRVKQYRESNTGGIRNPELLIPIPCGIEVRAVIGKQGSVQRNLRKDFCVQSSVDCRRRVVRVSGQRDNVNLAANELEQLFKSLRVSSKGHNMYWTAFQDVARSMWYMDHCIHGSNDIDMDQYPYRLKKIPMRYRCTAKLAPNSIEQVENHTWMQFHDFEGFVHDVPARTCDALEGFRERAIHKGLDPKDVEISYRINIGGDKYVGWKNKEEEVLEPIWFKELKELWITRKIRVCYSNVNKPPGLPIISSMKEQIKRTSIETATVLKVRMYDTEDKSVACTLKYLWDDEDMFWRYVGIKSPVSWRTVHDVFLSKPCDIWLRLRVILKCGTNPKTAHWMHSAADFIALSADEDEPDRPFGFTVTETDVAPKTLRIRKISFYTQETSVVMEPSLICRVRSFDDEHIVILDVPAPKDQPLEAQLSSAMLKAKRWIDEHHRGL
uniref:AlNc14C40G3439 protein n=1 Tax=Albugo laibachii Nc14 TaxID=890382 RepID=F0W9I0_9STRA|nr:AlNc14C40G3439 [Albugo laibachii Nc14]|eukprot:CCA17794.1 AlNc14C40G3439 [Albugo laibachii Nc14]